MAFSVPTRARDEPDPFVTCCPCALGDRCEARGDRRRAGRSLFPWTSAQPSQCRSLSRGRPMSPDPIAPSHRVPRPMVVGLAGWPRPAAPPRRRRAWPAGAGGRVPGKGAGRRPQPIVRGARPPSRLQLPAEAGDVGLQRGHDPGRRLLAPGLVDHVGHRHRPAFSGRRAARAVPVAGAHRGRQARRPLHRPRRRRGLCGADARRAGTRTSSRRRPDSPGAAWSVGVVPAVSRRMRAAGCRRSRRCARRSPRCPAPTVRAAHPRPRTAA